MTLPCGTVLCSFKSFLYIFAILGATKTGISLACRVASCVHIFSVFSYFPLGFDPSSPADMENVVEVLVSSGQPGFEF